MFWKPVTSMPEKLERHNTRNNSLKQFLLDFYNSDENLVEVIFMHGEYASSASLYSGLKKALESINSINQIPVEVEFRQGGIYLRRID